MNNMKHVKLSGRLGLFLVAAAFLYFVFPALAKPRPPQPPWPQATLKIFGFDSPYQKVPWRNVAINEEESTLVESWSGFALERSGLFLSPIIIPVRVSDKEVNLAPASGSIRFWLAPNWSTASENSVGKGPGHLAHLLELVNLGGKASDVRWSLYVNEAGDTIHFVGQTKLGLTELLKAPVAFTTGDWRMITLCYSETNTVLLLDNEVIAKGEGVVSPVPWAEKDLVLVVGSDVLASPESLAHAQFEELTTMRQWPSQSEWQALYFQSTKRRTLLGPLGTKEEELAKVAGLKAAGLLPEDYGLAKSSGEGDGPIVAYSYAEGDLWLEITGVTNPYAYLTLHGTVTGDWYQLLSKTNLTQLGEWTLGEYKQGEYGTNRTDFAPVYMADDTNRFFRAQHAASYLYLGAGGNAYEPNPVFSDGVSTFTIGNYGNTNLTAYYRMSGTASNGVDYTNLTGSVIVPAGDTVNISVHPLADNLLEGEETVTLTLVQTNNYVIDPTYAAATILLKDASTLVYVGWVGNAIEAAGPPGVAAQTGAISINRWDERYLYPALTVHYSIAGSASNGTDYTTLSGTVTLPTGVETTNLIINPAADLLVEGMEMVTLTVIPTNTYAIETNNASASVTIADSSTTVFVARQQDAIEPHPASNTPKQTGIFSISRTDTRFESPALTVSYQLTGTATNGIDYTNMTGTVTFQATQLSTNVFIEPVFDDQLEGNETVTLTVTHVGDGYLINPSFAAATLTIQDNMGTNIFQTVARMYTPVGIDYHPPTDSLIVSTNAITGEPRNFCRLFKTLVGTNSVTVITNWSGVHGAVGEVMLTTVKTTGNGFTNGDLYFGSGTAIGWISADATRSNINWCVLTNATQTNALLIEGGLCMDSTGVFSNQVIAVTSSGGYAAGKKGVWRVAANRTPTLVASIETGHFEGVTTLPNNVSQWGPWAGKIITGDETLTPPPIYTIAANGGVTTNDTTTLIAGGIRPEDFDLIPAGQDLYACDYYGNAVVKLSRAYLTNFVGQLLITQEGTTVNDPGKLFAVRWDAATTNFVARHLLTFVRPLEQVTFAPVSLPPLTP